MAVVAFVAVVEGYMACNTWNLLRPIGIMHALMAAVAFVIAILLSRFTITVTETHLTFGFGPFRKRMPLADVRRAHMVECSLRTTGVGIHYVAGYWAWVARTGPAVQIILKSGKPLGFIISTSRPRDLSAILNNET